MTGLEPLIIYSLRAKLIAGTEGGMPLNLTLPAMKRTLQAIVPSNDIDWQGVVLGHGDALVPALMHAMPRNVGIGGVEWMSEGTDHYLRIAASRMLANVVVPDTICWGTDITNIESLGDMLSCRTAPVVAYAFDDSIPTPARKHWYSLLRSEPLVMSVATTFHHKIDLKECLPEFKEVDRFRVSLAGGKCSRTMIILFRQTACI
jgi:hypothetical protein